jgi:hypothetical protein
MRAIHLAGIGLLNICLLNGIAHAAITPLQEVTEAMMISQGHDAFSMGVVFGDALGSLTFSSTVNSVDRTFSYASDSGQTFGGKAFSLVASGAFDQGTGEYVLSAIGSIGSRSFTRVGSVSFGAGTADAGSDWLCTEATRDNGDAIDFGTIECKITSMEVLIENGQINSTCKYDAVLQFKDGHTVMMGQGTGTDHLDSLSKPWSYKLRPWLILQGQPIAPVSTDSESFGTNSFSMTVSNPEPGSGMIASCALAATAMRRRRLKHRA